jgi:hypothetical protein
MTLMSENPGNLPPTGRPRAPKKPKSFSDRRGHRSDNPLAHLNKRTLIGRRIATLVERYLALLRGRLSRRLYGCSVFRATAYRRLAVL